MMDWFVKAFLKASLAWLGLGVTLGALMAGRPSLAGWRTAHIHMNLLGFVTMMIFGVAYHVIPRFTGHPLAMPRLARAHWWISNVGLALLATGFGLRGMGVAFFAPLLGVGATLSALGAYSFIVNVWRTIDGPKRLKKVVAATATAPETRKMKVMG